MVVVVMLVVVMAGAVVMVLAAGATGTVMCFGVRVIAAVGAAVLVLMVLMRGIGVGAVSRHRAPPPAGRERGTTVSWPSP